MQGADVELWGVLGIVAALTVGVVSPGPSFVMVARTAVAQGRRQGLAAALGMGLGGALFAVLALAGLQALLASVPPLFVALKLAGGAYLVYLGWRIWRGASEPLAIDDAAAQDSGSRRAFWLGLATQVSNPKTAVIYTSVFAAFLPAQHSMMFNTATVLAVFLVETGWYAIVAWALSATGPRAAYLGGKVWLDRLAGGVMALLGLRLLLTAHRA